MRYQSRKGLASRSRTKLLRKSVEEFNCEIDKTVDIFQCATDSMMKNRVKSKNTILGHSKTSYIICAIPFWINGWAYEFTGNNLP